jgi:hypothetical protein
MSATFTCREMLPVNLDTSSHPALHGGEKTFVGNADCDVLGPVDALRLRRRRLS